MRTPATFRSLPRLALLLGPSSQAVAVSSLHRGGTARGSNLGVWTVREPNKHNAEGSVFGGKGASSVATAERGWFCLYMVRDQGNKLFC